jgi:hypothetical protein
MKLALMVNKSLLIPLSCPCQASWLQRCSSSNHAGKPCVCNNGQRDSPRNPGFTGDGKTCNTLEPCMFNKIGAQVLMCSSFLSSRRSSRRNPNGRLLTWMHDATANRNSPGSYHRCMCACLNACAISARHFWPNVCLKEKSRCEMVYFSAIKIIALFCLLLNHSTAHSPQLTAEITKSCDYASNQRVLQVHLPIVVT